MAKRGKFIALEGGEGAGKSTQARKLVEALQAKGLDAIVTREPGGTQGAEAIRSLLLDHAYDWTPQAEALLFAAARSDHVTALIEPALARGTWVVCDRFIDSTRAYQGGASGLTDDAILALHAFGSGGLLPDLTVLIELPAYTSERRISARDNGSSDRIGGREAEFHARVAAAFADFAAADPDRFTTIDGEGDIDTVHQRIMADVRPMIQ